MRRGNGPDRAHLALLEPLLGCVDLLVELEPARNEILGSEPENDATVADVLALGRELDRVGRRAADGLVAPELRGGIGLRPGRHLLDEVQVVIAEIRADEALVPCPRGDLADALQLGEVEPLVGRVTLVREGEEPGALHLGGREEEEDRLPLVAGLPALVDFELPHPLAAPPVEDAELHVLMAIVPVLRGVLERLPAVENLPRRLGGLTERREREHEKQRRYPGGHPVRVHSKSAEPNTNAEPASP